MRIEKYLSKTGIGSRGFAKNLLKFSRIMVNDQIVRKEGYNVTENDVVYLLNGTTKQELHYEEFIYLMMNKPTGYVCATSDNLHKSVLSLINNIENRDLHIVGRLDIDTEGLLLITDDGNFVHQVTSPKSKIEKKYFFTYEGTLLQNASEILKEGIELDGSISKGILDQISDNTASLIITDGKFHEVKRMIHYVGGEITYLKRVSIGKLLLDDTLKVGEYRKIKEKEKINQC